MKFAQIEIPIYCEEEKREELEKIANRYDNADLAHRVREFVKEILDKELPELYID